jgi:hypothetical protein
MRHLNPHSVLTLLHSTPLQRLATHLHRPHHLILTHLHQRPTPSHPNPLQPHSSFLPLATFDTDDECNNLERQKGSHRLGLCLCLCWCFRLFVSFASASASASAPPLLLYLIHTEHRPHLFAFIHACHTYIPSCVFP